MPDIGTETLHVTGLTPSAPVDIAPAPDTPPAAPPPEPEIAAPEGEAQPIEQPADDQATPLDATAQTPDAPPVDKPKKPAQGVQKALDRLTGQREAEKQRADQAELLARQLAYALNATQQRAAPPQAPDTGPDPKQYKDWETFNQANTAWIAGRAANAAVSNQMNGFLGAVVAAQRQTADAAAQYVTQQKIAESVTKAPERFKDWDNVIASDIPVTPVIEHAIAKSADPAMAMRFLAQHPAEAHRLNQMPFGDAMYYAGQMFAVPARPVASKAPPPGQAVGGRSSPQSSTYRDDFTPEQHKAWVAKYGK